MKKLTIFLITFLMLTTIVCGAIWMPLPITGKVYGGNIADLPIEITNVRTGQVQKTKTTSVGEFLIDASNYQDTDREVRYVMGDEFKIVITSCTDNSACIKTVKYNGESGLHSVFDLSNVDLPCQEPKVCEVCQVIDEQSDWVKIGGGIVLALLSGLILFMGGGIKAYKNRAGGVTIQHKHRGVRSYHDANRSHIDHRYKHRRWKDDPVGCINDIKKIEEQGGL